MYQFMKIFSIVSKKVFFPLTKVLKAFLLKLPKKQGIHDRRPGTNKPAAFQPISYINPIQLQERMERHDRLILLDVREDYEVASSALPNITHIPMGQIPARLHELRPQDEIICICHLGQRAFHVAHYLQQQGFQNVYNLEGGMAAFVCQQSNPK